jgi:hypothetical protein
MNIVKSRAFIFITTFTLVLLLLAYYLPVTYKVTTNTVCLSELFSLYKEACDAIIKNEDLRVQLIQLLVSNCETQDILVMYTRHLNKPTRWGVFLTTLTENPYFLFRAFDMINKKGIEFTYPIDIEQFLEFKASYLNSFLLYDQAYNEALLEAMKYLFYNGQLPLNIVIFFKESMRNSKYNSLWTFMETISSNS